MAEFKTLITELRSGNTDLDAVLKWVDSSVNDGNTDPGQMLMELAEAEQDGFSGPFVTTLRAHIAQYEHEKSGPHENPAKSEEDDFQFDLGSLSLEPMDGEEEQAADPDKTVVDQSQPKPAAPAQPAQQPPADPDATVVDASKPAAGDDATIVNNDADATVVNSDASSDAAAEDKTQVMADDEATVVTTGNENTVRSGGEGDYDPFAVDSQPGSVSSPTGTGWPTGTAWPGRGGGSAHKTIGSGTILKDRFELISKLGEGGMGQVWKARDLLKVEAKDKNPYIAVKLLSGDFREHPEAFIALQRESSKAQKLAHPNIATVYDFDRDGSTVYMTMELMEGEELAKYIKKLPVGGLPPAEALGLVEQLCNGLEYAHARGLVHSDFKPGNAFLTKDGSLKLLDFGIARASKTRSDAAGETTMFDPGQLGALTPAYATVEMFDGMDPDPRDDIYALACVSYELLTGKHPFNKLSAVKVQEKRLAAAPVAKITKRQNKAIMRGLAIKREDRVPTVVEFWDGLKYKKSYKWQIAGGAVLLVAIVAGALFKPVTDYLDEQRDNEVITRIQQGGDVPAILQEIQILEDASQRRILEGAKDEIIGHFETNAETAVDATQNRYDYPRAFTFVDEAQKYYADSAQVASIRSSLENRRAQLIAELTQDFDTYLEEGRLMPVEQEDDITDILAKLRQAEPGNTLLSDARLTTAYATVIQQATDSNDYQLASDVLQVSLAFAPNDASLLNLDDQVKRELQRQADEQTVADIKGRLAAQQAGLASVENYAAVKDDLVQLSELRPDDQLLADISGPLQSTVESALQARITAQQFAEAEDILFNFSQLLEISKLQELRDNLSRAEISASYQPASIGESVARLNERRNTIEALLNNPTYNSEWNAALLKNFKEIVAMLRPGNAWFGTLREKIATVYLDEAHRLIEADRFDNARGLLAAGQQFYPDMERFTTERDLLANAEQEFQREQQERLRLARLEAMKNTLRVQTAAGEVTNAVRTLETLRSELPASDEFVTATAPRLIGEAYLKLATTRGEQGDFTNAVTFARRGLEIAPNMQALSDAVAQYSSQAERQSLQQLAGSATPSNINSLPGKLSEVQGLFPQDRTAIRNETLRTLANRIQGLESTDVVMANDLLAAAKNVFPNENTLASISLRQPPRPSRYVPQGRDAIQKFKLTEAEGILAEANANEPGHEQVAAFARELETAKANANQYYVAFQQLVRTGQTNQAKPYLDQALKLWSDSPQYLSDMQRYYATTRTVTRSADGSRPCTANLAGYGRSGRAECFDILNGSSRGPTMVVVPAGGAVSQPFAIGKYEVSVSDFNNFCNTSGQCSPLSAEASLPATGISYENAQAYVGWLSTTTGKSYRIPSEAEWVYAATATDANSNRDFNCRVTQGDQVLKGLSMLEVRTGRANPWGLINYVGNAQEWVSGGGNLVARGGAFQDNLSNCDINLAKAHTGSPDELTGFRVARDID
ncbi:MAG: bifunctional serine/threonine-protein kinase/formylglycine-generating enzyme family protein [Gammaproteobacteria bacterium]|nr:bifunctional serine/threonine-protein kinase/formylglycine-generating enzyme family protein [Gammaproteobacteria bacterium]